jgi:hypothetical protein
VVHDTRLGLDGVQDGSEASWSDLERAVREITGLPLKYGNGARIEHISRISRRFADAEGSRNVMAERYNILATRDGAIEPLFAAGRCVAWYTWTRLIRQRMVLHVT